MGVRIAAGLALVLVIAGCNTVAPSVSPSEPAANVLRYGAPCVDGRCPTSEDLAVIREIVTRRLQALGVDATVDVDEAAREIHVGLPAGVDPGQVDPLIAQAGAVTVVPIPPDAEPPVPGASVDHPPLLAGDVFTDAAITIDPQDAVAVNLQLAPEARAVFSEHTSRSVGDFFAITLDGRAVSVPQIVEAIPGGEIQIVGGPDGFELDDAQRLMTAVKFGTLPFALAKIDD